ncbi:hypothetical protein SC984_14995, partial [Legionella pneumophila serogroup 1]
LAEKIWIINESVSYFNEFRPLDCFVATLLATTVPKIVPYRAKLFFLTYLFLFIIVPLASYKCLRFKLNNSARWKISLGSAPVINHNS